MSQFDDIIRGKLAQLPSEGTPDWDALRDQLDGSDFDALISKPLSAPVAGASSAIVGWDALNDKLDVDAERTGELFDEMLADRLRFAEVAETPQASWTQLSHRMDTFWPLRRKLVRYRALEIAAAVALLFTFAPLLRDNPIFHEDGGAVAQADASPHVLAGPQPLSAKQLEAVFSLSESDLWSTDASVSAMSANANVSESPSVFRTPTAMLDGAVEWLGTWISEVDETRAASNSQHAVAMQAQSTTSTDGTFAANTMRVDGATVDLSRRAELIESLSLEPLAIDLALPSVAKPVTPKAAAKWGVGPVVGLQSWKVQTPRDFDFAQTARTHTISSAQAGLGVTHQLSERFGLGFGVSLTRLSYDPDFPTVVQPGAYVIGPISLARAESFENISLNLAQVPVELRFNVLPADKKLGLHLKAGLAGNFALNTEYDLRTTIAEADQIQEFNQPPGFGPSASSPAPIVRNELPSVAKPFVEGVFDSGLSRSNSYVSGRVGIEASYSINKYIDVFSGIDYSRFLPFTDGFGPNSDAFSTVGVSLGSRINL